MKKEKGFVLIGNYIKIPPNNIVCIKCLIKEWGTNENHQPKPPTVFHTSISRSWTKGESGVTRGFGTKGGTEEQMLSSQIETKNRSTCDFL